MKKILSSIFLYFGASFLFAQDSAYEQCVQEAMRSGGPAAVAACNLSRSQAVMESSANRIIKALPSQSNSQRTTVAQSQTSRQRETANISVRNNSTSNSSSRAESIVDNLSRLSDLYEKGLLTEEEFQQAKRAALGLD